MPVFPQPFVAGVAFVSSVFAVHGSIKAFREWTRNAQHRTVQSVPSDPSYTSVRDQSTHGVEEKDEGVLQEGGGYELRPRFWVWMHQLGTAVVLICLSVKLLRETMRRLEASSSYSLDDGETHYPILIVSHQTRTLTKTQTL